MPLLELRNVSRFFGRRAASSDVSFSVEKGSILGLIGPRGAGKTTLCNCITGVDKPDRGEIRFRGVRLNGMSPARICKQGLVRTWQKAPLLTDLTALDNVVMGALCRTGSLDAARAEAMEQLRVAGMASRADVPAGALTACERRKLEVARALATRPELLVLDEPMGGLDPAESDEVIRLLLALRQAGLTQLVVEHDARSVLRISDRVVVLAAGEKLAEGTPAQVVENREVVAAYLGEVS